MFKTISLGWMTWGGGGHQNTTKKQVENKSFKNARLKTQLNVTFVEASSLNIDSSWVKSFFWQKNVNLFIYELIDYKSEILIKVSINFVDLRKLK